MKRSTRAQVHFPSVTVFLVARLNKGAGTFHKTSSDDGNTMR